MTVVLQPLVNLVQHHETSYREIQQFIEKPPGQLRIFEIYPPKPLHSIALGSRIPALREDYKLAFMWALFSATVGKLLTEKSAAEPPSGAGGDAGVDRYSACASRQRYAGCRSERRPQANDPTFNNEDLA